jgi:hypothetical protein
MRRRTGAGRAELHLGLVRLGVGDEFLEIADRQILARFQHQRHFGDENDRREIFGRIVERMFVQRLALRMGADGAEHELIAVRLGIDDARRAGHAAGAGDIFDHDVLAEHLAHARRDDAAEHIGRAAGGERHHHGQWMIGKWGGARRRVETQTGGGQRHEQLGLHGHFFPVFSLYRGTRGRGQSLGAERRFLQHSANVRVNFHGFGDVCSVSAYRPSPG